MHYSLASFISEISNTLIDNEEDLGVIVSMYKLLSTAKIIQNKKQKNKKTKKTESFWNYYRDEWNSGVAENKNYSIRDSKSFDYKTSITGKLEGINTEKEKVKIIVPLKYSSNFWRTLDIQLISCAINFILTWSENCIITSKVIRYVDTGVNPAVVVVNNPTNATFKKKTDT